MRSYKHIFEKICDMENLRLAHINARRDKKYYKEVKMVDSDPDKYLKEIQDMLLNDTYEVSEYTYQVINDSGKERELMKLPYFPDRIIQWAIMLQIEPIFMEVFCNHVCASIPDRGIRQASELVKKYLKDEEGTKYCLKLDIRHFYPNVDHEKLKELLRKKFRDKRLLDLLYKIIDSYPGDKGLPIGSYLSQFLANFYLAYFDHWLKEEVHLRYVVRYMDDIIILHHSKAWLHEVLWSIKGYLQNVLKVRVKPNWQVFPVECRSIDFVGYRYFHKFTLLRLRTCKNLKKKLTAIKRKQDKGNLINYTEFCCINSYSGLVKNCDSYRLRQKYIEPVMVSSERYHKIVIKNKKKKEVKAA